MSEEPSTYTIKPRDLVDEAEDQADFVPGDQQEPMSIIGSLRKDNEHLTLSLEQKNAMLANVQAQLTAAIKFIHGIKSMTEAFIHD